MRLGFIGNHPFFTRSFCSNSSPIPQSNDAPVTPSKADQNIEDTNKAATQHPNPPINHNHHGLVPK